jgi:hypothetical protein
MIGHASLLVETEDAKILMDPVLWDPFYQGLNETCPKREVIPQLLPEFDILVISHQHLDHFDLRSLAYLPKHIDVFIPNDPLMINVLKELGYRNVYPLSDFQQVKIGSTVLMTTRSEVRVPEFGMVFADSSGVFWNTVDTYFAPPTIQKVKSIFEQIDFLLTTWHISLECKYQLNQNYSFPSKLYQLLFRLIQQVDPIAIAPGAQGWKYINEGAWQNQVVFPVTRERFCTDLAQVFPRQEHIYILDPGDIFTLDRGTYQLEVEGCDYVKKIVDDRELIDFCPVNIGKTLKDKNSDAYDVALMEQTIEQVICEEFSSFVREHLHTQFAEHCRWQVIYQLEVIFPEGCRQWQIDFSQPDIRVVEGRNPLANFFTCITASSLYGLIEAIRDWDYLFSSGEYRQFHKVYQINSTEFKRPSDELLIDPLYLKYPSKDLANKWIKTELAKLKSQNQVNEIEDAIASSEMINLGNVLIRAKK